ncbi:MAG: hypothetical protein CMG35_12000 [Candidatus Marinimicrobia bacterium]|nr:hypothetical protein [Candidatus Neomarinimicrobiota bacterium]MBO03354.1 hypothetical protein [Candidatus Neomarinimicrobiota bacterium]
MAEEVDIGNVGGQNGVASEATLARLTTSIEAMAKKMGIDPKAEAAKLQKLHNEAVKSGITVSTKNRDALKDNVKATKETTKATSNLGRAMAGAMLGAVGATLGAIKGFSNELLQGGEQFGDFTKHIPILGNAIAPLASLIDNTVESYRQLSTVGGTLGNSITEVRRAAANLELNMGEYAGLIMQSSEAMRMLGGNVAAGQIRFAAMNKSLKATGDFAALKNLGFTVMELNEGMVDYISLQRNLGRLEGKSNADLAKGSAAYLKQIDLLARATGKSRKEVEAQLAAQATDAGIRGLLNALGEGTKEFENLQASLSLIDTYGGEASYALKDLLDGVVQDDRTAKFLAALGPGADEVKKALEAVGAGADPQVLLDAFSRAGGELEKFAQIDTGDKIADAKARAAFIAQLRKTQPEIADFLDASTKMAEAGQINLKQVREDQKKIDQNTQNMTTFDDAIKSLRATIQTALIDSGLFDALGDAMGGLSEVFGSAEFKKRVEELAEAFASKTKEFIDLFKEGGFKAVFDRAVSGLGSVLGDAFVSAITNPKVILGIAGAFAALFALKAVSGALVSGIGGMFGGGGGGKSLPGGKPGATTGGAKIGKSVGGFVGGLGEGVMKGAAAGLRAFAHPMVPVGAAALGAAIVAIGAGIAGASWILGKALPTFVDGLKSFEDLDGAKIGAAGDAMVSLSLGMAAFGAGTAVAGLGTLVGSISEGIGQLFGADDPITRIQKFADANIDGAKVKTNAEAMVAFGNAMMSLPTTMPGSGVFAAFGQAIAGFFGAQTPFEQLTNFGNMDLNAEKVKANSEALVAFGNALSSMPSDELGTLSLHKNFVSNMKELATVDSEGLSGVSTSLASITSIPNLSATLGELGDLGKNYRNVEDLAEAMEDLADAMKEVNRQSRSGRNNARTGNNTDGGDTSAGSIIAGLGSNSGQDQLNTTMQRIEEILARILVQEEMTASNTKKTSGSIFNLAERLN